MRRESIIGMVLVVAFAYTASARAQARPATGQAAKRAADTARMEALERELQRQAAELEAMRAELAQQKEAAASAEAAKAAEAEAQPSEEEQAALAALLAESQAERDASGEGPSLRLYGFADVGLQRAWTDGQLAPLSPDSRELTFVLGNLNLYLDANVSPNWRFLAEIRFMLGPNGAVRRPNGFFWTSQTEDTAVSDPSSANGAFSFVRWAGVVPQRAHIDWTPRDWFNLRAGLFLTPYGIWNVDHGTPTRIMATEPLFLSTQLVPSQLLGVEMFGTLPTHDWTLGYHLHVSNGRMLGQVDLTDDKAVGGRFWASTHDPFPIKLGVSAYWGRSTGEKRSLSVRQTTYAAEEASVAGDLSIDAGSLRIRSELVASWIFYQDGKRPDLLGTTLADAMRLGAYALAAYQLPWWGIEPLLMFEYLRYPIPRALPVGRGVIWPSTGVNVYFTAATMLRTQFSLARGVDLGPNAVQTSGFLYQCAARLITAF